ncbi:MAG: carboxypeptidase-like regulatory domain-containing protein, partial [Nonlabens sp.]|nr:carboxypeptidase-like regulatory domain-containing protein [Nonlabens sp.]
MKTTLTLLFLALCCLVTAQTAIIYGVILDEDNNPIPNVNIIVENSLTGTTTDATGAYTLTVPAKAPFTIKFTAVNLQPVEIKDLVLRTNEQFWFNPVMKVNIEQIVTIVIERRNTREFAGITTIDPPLLRKIPGAQPGVENLLKSLPGVISNNELSTQYGVRGGNYDENLVYINE